MLVLQSGAMNGQSPVRRTQRCETGPTMARSRLRCTCGCKTGPCMAKVLSGARAVQNGAVSGQRSMNGAVSGQRSIAVHLVVQDGAVTFYPATDTRAAFQRMDPG